MIKYSHLILKEHSLNISNSNVRQLVAELFPGVELKSYTDKLRAKFLYRIATENAAETAEVLKNIDTHRKAFPSEIVYFQAYGIDGFDNNGAVIHVGTNYIPHVSPMLNHSLTFSVL